MAIYHLTTKPISRSAGRSATAAAAYRSAEKIEDRTSGEVFDYTRKRGVEHTEIVLPTKVAKADINWPRDRQQLWNAAEEAEKRKDARVAREYEIALPQELNKSQRLELVREFAAEIANRHGVAVDFAIHKAHREGDQRNYHAHVMATTRQIEATGLGSKAAIEWSDTDRAKNQLSKGKEELTAIRERWAALANVKLNEHGHQARIDHRTLAAQGIDREPTVHKGVAVTALERRGIQAEVSKRIAWEEKGAVQKRLELAAEQGAIERERLQASSELLSLSTDITAAKRVRAIQHEFGLARTEERRLTPTEQREQARADWLAHRSDLKRASERTLILDQSLAATKASSLSTDQLREKARDEWLALRKGEAQGRAGDPDRSKGREKGAELASDEDKRAQRRDKSKGKDDDFAL